MAFMKGKPRAAHRGVSREYVLRVRQAVTCDQVTSEKTTERTYTTKHGTRHCHGIKTRCHGMLPARG